MKNINKKVLFLLFLIIALIMCMLLLAGCRSSADGRADGGAVQEESDKASQEDTDKASQEDMDKASQENTDETGKNTTDKSQEVQKVNTDNITVNTQSSIRIKGSKTIYIDPYKRSKATHDADMILITHAHYDHYDEPSLRNVAGDKTFVVCPDSMSGEVNALGLGKAGSAAMEPGAEIKPEGEFEGITIKAVPAYNLNKNFHPKANGWVGYVIKMDGVTYYAAGDTDALSELEDVKCDIAFVPIGGTYTMTAKEAAGLINKIKPEIAVPIHYGTIVGSAKDVDTFKAAVDGSIKVVTKVEDAR